MNYPQFGYRRVWQFTLLFGSATLLLLALQLAFGQLSPRLLYAHAPTAAPPTLLAIYVLAFDNQPNSPHSLTAYYTSTVQSIIDATRDAPDRVAVILADLAGYGDTHVLLVQHGVAVPVAGLPNAEALASPVTLDPTLIEYDMADGWYVGNFIRWARELYPAPTTLFSFVGHGAPLTPQLHPLTEGSPIVAPTMTPTPIGTPVPQDEVNPLPPRWGAHSALTDDHSASLISVRSLAQALSIGTAQGTNPLTVVDLLHCFSASIEELYELHPYARTMIAAPNYTYAQPTMLGETLATLDATQPPSALAQAVVASYDSRLPAADHPRLFIAVAADKIAPIKAAWDQTTEQLIAAWQADATAARAALLAAYAASAKYDTTICQPQDWQLAPPDALSDMADFAHQLRVAFGAQSPVGQWALTATQTISAAIIARHQHDGIPWFAAPTPAEWRFPAAGIALFTDFAPDMVDNRPRFSWQAAWYTYTVSTGNLYPYAFIQPTSPGLATWADLFTQVWTTPITATTGCVPGFVSGRGVGELRLTKLTLITNNIEGAIFFSTTVASAQAATNPLLRFRVLGPDGHPSGPLFEEVIGVGYLTAASRRTIQSRTGWRPPYSGQYRIEATIDLDNRFLEADEADNSITLTLPLSGSNLIYLPVIVH